MVLLRKNVIVTVYVYFGTQVLNWFRNFFCDENAKFFSDEFFEKCFWKLQIYGGGLVKLTLLI